MFNWGKREEWKNGLRKEDVAIIGVLVEWVVAVFWGYFVKL